MEPHFNPARRQKRNVLRLQYYREPPSGKIQISELEELALERKELLELIETVGQDAPRDSDKYAEHLNSRLLNKKSFLAKIISYKMDREDTSNKEIEHDIKTFFVLLSAYCRSELDRRWFLQQEVDLFRYRFRRLQNENPGAVEQFLTENDLHFSLVTPEELKDCRRRLKELGCSFSYIGDSGDQKCYKVVFTDVLELVKNRKVYLTKGQVYVPSSELFRLVSSRYRAHISRCLSVMSLAQVDPRIDQILSLIKRSNSGDFNQKPFEGSNEVKAFQVDSLVQAGHFPLCQQHLHNMLRREGHLRHSGRLQYGLFLKGIGLSLEESLIFWRTAFSKKIPADKFDKQYAYSIRYNYGKEGKRVDMTPYSCYKIISGPPPGQGDHSGCPFRHWDSKLLRQTIEGRIPPRKVDSVMIKAENKHYEIACREYFKAVHSLESVDIVINHPNSYFAQSLKVSKGELADSIRKPVSIVKVSNTDKTEHKEDHLEVQENVLSNPEEDLMLLEALEMMEK